MDNQIKVERYEEPMSSMPDSLLDPGQLDRRRRGIVATITLTSKKACAYIFEWENGRFGLIYGSRALFGRWRSNLVAGPDPRD
jgi:hypothetical protein